MNLIIDIGNSRAKVSLYDQGKMLCHQTTDNQNLLAHISDSPYTARCKQCIISATADIPDLLVESLNKRSIKTLVLSGNTPLPFVNDYRTPLTLGSDRLAAVAGAVGTWAGENILIVDAGTCITYEVVTANGHYIGGNIAPGLKMRFAAMAEHTAHLPLTDAQGALPIVGYDTTTAMRAGVMRGLKYEIEGYIHYLYNKYGKIRTILTGGDSQTLRELVEAEVVVDNQLVSRGLDHILRHNETQS